MLKMVSYKMGNFYKNVLKENYYLLVKKGENTLQKGPRKQWLPLGPFFFVLDTRGLTLMKIKYAPNGQLLDGKLL